MPYDSFARLPIFIPLQFIAFNSMAAFFVPVQSESPLFSTPWITIAMVSLTSLSQTVPALGNKGPSGWWDYLYIIS